MSNDKRRPDISIFPELFRGRVDETGIVPEPTGLWKFGKVQRRLPRRLDLNIVRQNLLPQRTASVMQRAEEQDTNIPGEYAEQQGQEPLEDQCIDGSETTPALPSDRSISASKKHDMLRKTQERKLKNGQK